MKRNKRQIELYERVKKRATIAEKIKSQEGRDIGDIPAIKNSKRKAKALRNFKYFCEEYYAITFYNPWSPDHLKAIRKIQKAVLNGELFVFAMPRGSGKTSLTEAALVWAALTGIHEYIFVIGGTDPKATKIVENIKTQLSTKEKLLEDFPESIYPIVYIY